MIELRVDTFHDVDATGALVRHASLPVILTRRAASEGGENHDADVDRIRFLNECAVATRRYTDLELATYRNFPDAAQREGWRLILSAHDFRGRPDRIYNLIDELNQSRSDINKVV